jgi:hypothetical protein
VIVVQISNVWIIIWTVVCALSSTKAQIILARLMAGIGGSASLAVSYRSTHSKLNAKISRLVVVFYLISGGPSIEGVP